MTAPSTACRGEARRGGSWELLNPSHAALFMLLILSVQCPQSHQCPQCHQWRRAAPRGLTRRRRISSPPGRCEENKNIDVIPVTAKNGSIRDELERIKKNRNFALSHTTARLLVSSQLTSQPHRTAAGPMVLARENAEIQFHEFSFGSRQ